MTRIDPQGGGPRRAASRRPVRADSERSGAVTVKLEKLPRGVHKLRIRYTGGPAATIAKKTIKVRVRR